MTAHSLVFCGDLVLDEPDPDHWLSGIAPCLRAASLSIGHLEVPHTRRGRELTADVPAPGAPPEHLVALAHAGIDALTLAGNHMADCGAEGIADTLAELDRIGIRHCGAGANLACAREPLGFRPARSTWRCSATTAWGREESWAQPRLGGLCLCTG